jgi:hypothetical protein
LVFYEVDPDHGQGKQLAKTKLSALAASDVDWDVSPDGAHVVVTGMTMSELRGLIRVLDLKTGTERNLPLPQGWRVSRACWAADSKALLIAAQTTTYFLARLELDGKWYMLLDRGRDNWLSSQVLSRDGRHLAFYQQTFDVNACLLENF